MEFINKVIAVQLMAPFVAVDRVQIRCMYSMLKSTLCLMNQQRHFPQIRFKTRSKTLVNLCKEVQSLQKMLIVNHRRSRYLKYIAKSKVGTLYNKVSFVSLVL